MKHAPVCFCCCILACMIATRLVFVLVVSLTGVVIGRYVTFVLHTLVMVTIVHFGLDL